MCGALVRGVYFTGDDFICSPSCTYLCSSVAGLPFCPNQDTCHYATSACDTVLGLTDSSRF